MEYKGYTIEEDSNRSLNARMPQFMFYPTSEGIQHDGDSDADGYYYCGNCKWAGSIEEAQEEIDEILNL